MKLALLGCLVGGLVLAGTQDADLNVNRRYTVDSVVVAGKGWRADVAEPTDKMSNGLRKDMMALVGQKLNPGVLDELAGRLKKELSAREVSHHIVRSDVPDHIRVEFEVRQATLGVTANLTKFLYNSKQGWSGGGMVGFTARQNAILVGLISDGDTLNERFAGINARYENKHLGTDRVGFRFDFESYHQQWNQGTLDALARAPGVTSDAYRTRQTFAPMVTIELAKPLTLEVGAAFELLGSPLESTPDQGANALVTGLRYHQRLTESNFQEDVSAYYTLRLATRMLNSDFVFASHLAGLHYRVGHGKHRFSDAVAVGSISGRAPLADRFVAGNSYYLRGWSKYEIDPIGGNRLAHNTVDYRYGPLQVFYDAGAVWDSGQPATLRHAVGIGVRESVFTLAVAFPVRSGRVEPVFMMGMIY
jgi:Omp85 superfamily domain